MSDPIRKAAIRVRRVETGNKTGHVLAGYELLFTSTGTMSWSGTSKSRSTIKIEDADRPSRWERCKRWVHNLFNGK